MTCLADRIELRLPKELMKKDSSSSMQDMMMFVGDFSRHPSQLPPECRAREISSSNQDAGFNLQAASMLGIQGSYYLIVANIMKNDCLFNFRADPLNHTITVENTVYGSRKTLPAGTHMAFPVVHVKCIYKANFTMNYSLQFGNASPIKRASGRSMSLQQLPVGNLNLDKKVVGQFIWPVFNERHLDYEKWHQLNPYADPDHYTETIRDQVGSEGLRSILQHNQAILLSRAKPGKNQTFESELDIQKPPDIDSPPKSATKDLKPSPKSGKRSRISSKNPERGKEKPRKVQRFQFAVPNNCQGGPYERGDPCHPDSLKQTTLAIPTTQILTTALATTEEHTTPLASTPVFTIAMVTTQEVSSIATTLAIPTTEPLTTALATTEEQTTPLASTTVFTIAMVTTQEVTTPQPTTAFNRNLQMKLYHDENLTQGISSGLVPVGRRVFLSLTFAPGPSSTEGLCPIFKECWLETDVGGGHLQKERLKVQILDRGCPAKDNFANVVVGKNGEDESAMLSFQVVKLRDERLAGKELWVKCKARICDCSLYYCVQDCTGCKE